MSIGWITQVASIPEAPPLTKGFTAVQTPIGATFFSSAISAFCFWGSYGLETRRRDSAERKEIGGERYAHLVERKRRSKSLRLLYSSKFRLNSTTHLTELNPLDCFFNCGYCFVWDLNLGLILICIKHSLKSLVKIFNPFSKINRTSISNFLINENWNLLVFFYFFSGPIKFLILNLHFCLYFYLLNTRLFWHFARRRS